jgi:hypothetical protein
METNGYKSPFSIRLGRWMIERGGRGPIWQTCKVARQDRTRKKRLANLLEDIPRTGRKQDERRAKRRIGGFS